MPLSTDHKAVIFAVDDDADELTLIKRALDRRYGNDYDIQTDTSCQAGLARIQRLVAAGADVAMALADMNMPDMTGVEFLAAVGTLSPDTKRITLITWGELEGAREPVLRAVARGDVEGIVAKPWRDAHESFYRELTSFLEQWDHDHRPQFEAIKIVAGRWDVGAQTLRDALHRSGVPFGTYEPDSDAGRQILTAYGADAARDLPLVVVHDGQVLIKPSTSDVAAALHVNAPLVADKYDVTIVGSGPAGLAAAVYAASEGLSVIIVEQSALGGQASSSTMIRNYLGFPRGLSGAELTARGYRQAWFFGAQFVIGRNAIRLRVENGDKVVGLDDGAEIRSRAVILAAGVAYRRLQAEGVDRLVGRGVFYGAPVTEAPGLTGEDVVVVGGGNSSAQMALYMLRFARRVTLVTRNADLSDDMSDYLVQDIHNRPNIEVRLRANVVAVEGTDRLTGVRLHHADGHEDELLPAGGLFIMIGAEPQTGWLPAEIERDERGYVATGDAVKGPIGGMRPRALETSIAGVFAVGDVRLGSLKRIAAAVGEGSTVVRMCHDYFAEQQLE